MHQVLFRIPFKPFAWLPSWWPDAHLTIYGFGVMLALTLLVCTWIASRRARQEGIPIPLLQDLAVWIFVCGLIGARIVYVIQFYDQFRGKPWYHYLMIWEGGIVFYGSAVGGVVGYALAYVFQLRRHQVLTWKLADIIAPAAAIGLCLGRVGCFLNGCCYGNVACTECPAVHFPLSSPARYSLVEQGDQTAAGFTLMPGREPATVAAVEPDSPAEQSGLCAHDVIEEADGHPIRSDADLNRYLSHDWPRGKNDLILTISREGKVLELGPFYPRTLGLHPTQIYESISMFLLFLLLGAYLPFRRQPGEVMVLFIVGYAVHRYLDEMLRNDTPKVALNMTLSQLGSLFFLGVAAVLACWLWLRPAPARSDTALKMVDAD